MNKKEILQEIQRKLFHISIAENDKVQIFLTTNTGGFKYLKFRDKISVVKKVLSDKEILPLIMEKDEEEGYYVSCGFLKDEVIHKYGFCSIYDLPGKLKISAHDIEEGMRKRASAENIKEVISEAKEMFNENILIELMHLSLLNNKKYKDEKCITYEHLFCFLEFLIDLNEVPNLKKEAEKIISFF